MLNFRKATENDTMLYFNWANDLNVRKHSFSSEEIDLKEHKTWFNAEKLLEMLKLAGFEEVYKSAYMQSRSPILRNPNFFDNTHPDISVYVEAVK